METKVEVIKFNQDTIATFPEEYIKGFYIRPDNHHRGWDEYKHEESYRIWDEYKHEESYRIINIQKWIQRNMKLKIFITELIRVYTPKWGNLYELMNIIVFDKESIIKTRYYGETINKDLGLLRNNVRYDEIFDDGIDNSECVLDIRLIGQDSYKLVINESY